MRKLSGHLLRVFITGALAALPLAATVAIFAWAFAFLRGLLGPRSPFGELLGRIGLGVAESEILGYLVGMALIVLSVLALLGLVLTGRIPERPTASTRGDPARPAGDGARRT